MQKRVVDLVPRLAHRLNHVLQVDRVPQHDGRCDQVQAAGSVSLLLETAVANLPQPVEEHNAGQRVAGFAFVQPRLGVLGFAVENGI